MTAERSVTEAADHVRRSLRSLRLSVTIEFEKAWIMMYYSTPYQALQDALRRYNEDRPEAQQLPLIPFHGLRHTSATLLIASGQDIKTTSKRLGHAQTSTTMNIYAHALEESDKKAASALETMLAKRA